MGKVALLREPWRPSCWGPGQRPSVVTEALPLYRSLSSRGGYVHRIRSGLVHYPGVFKVGHLSYTMWCGQSGSSSKGRLSDHAERWEVVCATCEGRAVGAGLPSIALWAYHPVKFSPRK